MTNDIVAVSSSLENFLQYLTKNSEVREKLQDASAAEVVQAGKDAGYDFTENDLYTLIQRATVTSDTGIPIPTNSCWPFVNGS